MHYRRVIRFGGPGPAFEIGKAASLEQRFNNAVQPEHACHIWHGSVSKNGYGTIGVKRQKLYAHRIAWQLAYGEYPLGRISWLCGNRLCVRADHMRLT